MAECKFILGNKVFDSEILLDDYLSEMKDLYKKYGDLVFSLKWTPAQQHIREKVFNLKNAVEEALKSGKIKIEFSLLDSMDLDGLIGSNTTKGVTDLIKEIKTLGGNNIFPIFDSDNYWNEIRKDLKSGNFERFKDYVQYIFDEKDSDGNYITHPIESEEEFNQIRKRVENIWKLLGLIGTVVHDIFDIFYKSYQDEEGNNIKKLPKEQYIQEIKKILLDKSNAYKKLLKDFSNDPLENDNFLSSVIDNCRTYDKELRKQFGKDIMILSEILIRGFAALNNQLINVIGRMDMLVVTPDGDINIIDYKCSPKEYKNYNDAKKLTFEYLLAVYRRILQQMGINKESIRLWTVPILFLDFLAEKGTDKVTTSGIKFRDNNLFEELPNSRSTINYQRYTTIEDNLSNTFSDTYVEDVDTDKVLERTKNWISTICPQYGNITEVNDENVKKYLEKRKVYNEETGTWGYRRYKSGDLLFPECKSEEELVSKVKKEWENNRNRNLERTKDVKKALKEASKRGLGRSAVFDIVRGYKDKNTKQNIEWAQQILQKYASKKYRVVDTPPAFDSLGILLVRDTDTDAIDVIKLSSTYDVDAKLTFGNNRTTLFGNYINDHGAESMPESLVMTASRGNIELMETMYALNCLPSLFANYNAHLGQILLISPYNEGGGANNKTLLWNFSQLLKFSESKEHPQKNNFSMEENDLKPIHMASFLQLAYDSLHRILDTKDGEYRWKSVIESANQLSESYGNKEKTLAELIKLKKTLEDTFSILRDNINISVYDDYNSPEIRLYAEVMLAIGELNKLNYYQLDKDHANYIEGNIMKAFLWDGINGNLTDNPGTLRSKTLNEVSHLVDVAYQNIRDLLFKYKNNIEPSLDKLKQENGRFNQESIYGNFYNKDIKDDLVFKNPFSDPSLTDTEREILKKILLDITSRRKPNVQTMEDLEVEIDNNPNALLVPLISKSGTSPSKSLNGFWGGLRKLFVSLNPLNWREKLAKTIDLAVEEDSSSYNAPDSIWQLTNEIDSSRYPNIRLEMITSSGGISNFETDLEMLALKHEYAYIQKEEVDKIMPLIKALSIHLANLSIILNDNFEHDLSYILNFVRAKVQNKSLENLESLGEFKKAANTLMKTTSIMALAFNPKLLYQIIDGLWKDVRLIIQYDDDAFTFKNFKDSFFWIILDIGKAQGSLSLGEALNQQYGINDMDINSLPSRYAKDTFGTDRLQKAMFRFASRPDYYNRMTIFGALMRGDGCFEAHSVVDGQLVYDWTKDKRFNVFAKAKGNINNVSSSEIKKFNEQKALYYAMAQEMVKDGTLNPDGSKFVLDYKNPKPLPKAYTVRLSEAMKALGDKTYGYYASEKRSLIQSFTLGAIVFQMNTFWSSKKNQYFTGRGYTQEGEWVDYEEVNPEDSENPIKYYQKYNEETGEMDIVTEDTGLTFKVWKGKPQEGIIITLNHIIADFIRGRRDYEGQSLINMYWNNEDPYLRKMYRANLKQLFCDLFGMLFIGWLIAPSLVNSANSYAKEVGAETIDAASMGWMATLGASMLDLSADDFNFTKSVFGRGTQWTPFSVKTGWNAVTGLYNAITGDPDMYDTIVKSVSFTRNSKPIFNYVKLHTLGRAIGDNGED